MNKAVTESFPYWPLSGFYFTYFTLLGALFPYWSLYLQSLGFSASEIGLLLSVPMLTKVVAPNAWGWLADYTGRRLLVVQFGSAAAAVCFAFIFLGQGFALLMLVLASYSFFWNAVLPQHEAITIGFLKHNPEKYGRVRVWGSVGFILAVIVCGDMFEALGISLFPRVGLVLLVAMWLSSLTIPRGKGVVSQHNQGDNFLRECRRPAVLGFLLAGLFLQISHGVYYSFFSIYMAELGFDRGGIGLLWAIGVGAEIAMFIFMHHLMLRFSIRFILVFSLIVSVVRWLLIGHFAEMLVVLVFAQALHAFTFGAFHAGSIESIRRLFSPVNQGKGQATYSATSFGIGGAIGSVCGGYVWEVSPTLSYDFAALMSLIAVCLVLFWVKDKHLQQGGK